MKHRKYKSWIRRGLPMLLCLVGLVCGMPFVSSAAANTPDTAAVAGSAQRTVRIAFPTQGGMSGVGGSGDLVGYNYEYLQELSEYAGWNLEYITFEDMSANDGIMSAMQMVLDGEADLLGPMLKSDAVEQMFDFPQDNYGVVYTTLCALEKSSITSVNYSKITPLRVAVYATADTRNKEVTDYLDQLGVAYELIPCETSDEQLTLLEQGKADVLSSITLSYFDGTRSVAQFAPRPYYFVTTKGNAALLAELDAATQALNYTRPYLQQQLQEKFFGDTSSGYVLTDAELQHMEKLQTINVLCASKSDAPYVVEHDDGTPAGMLVSLLNDFAALNGIKISYTFCDTPLNMEQAWKTGHYDCLIGAPFSSEYCSSNGLVRTESITSVDLVLFAQPQTEKPLNESTVAIYSRLADQINLDGYGKVIQYDDPMECYDAVERGAADYGCSDRLITEYTIFERDSALVTVPLMGEKEDICVAVSAKMGNEFLSALNKYIHTLSDSTKTTYLSEGSRHESKGRLNLLIHDHPIETALIISGIVILLISLIFFAFYASQSKKKNLELQKANAAKSEFLARMSHDIRTPMNAIVGYLSIAQGTEGCPEKVEHCIGNCEVAAKHLLQLINDVLDMSSIESGKMKIAGEEFDLRREISDAATIFYQTSKTKGVRFETQVVGISEEWVVGDQLRMNQIVMNLLSNAVKFTPEGGVVQFKVEELAADESGSDLKISVSDTGIGMSEAYLQRLFQPFEQESADTARQYGGSGLGLSIVHNLVTMMGGTITVESKQNVGTTFTVLLHFAKAVKHSRIASPLPENANFRVLLVSGSEEKAEGVQSMLKAIGVRSDVVTDGVYAIKRIRRRQNSEYPYSLCLLDWQRMDGAGAKTAANIKVCAPSGLGLIAVGYDVTEFEEVAKAAGIDGFMTVPLFRSSLVELIHTVISGGVFSERHKKVGTHVDLTGKRVILAEDNAMNLEIAITVLEKSGLQIDAAENGKQALERFEAAAPGTYDFILMDVQMPVMDGYEATKAIRALKHPDAATIPIIAMTANAFAEDVTTALANGMNAHIAKPVNYDKLFSVLNELDESQHKSSK